MEDFGGFEHNRQGLRVVDLLEERYPDFRGLNLTWEVREGIIKHATTFDQPEVPIEFDSSTMPSLEAQVVNVADEIAFNNHDLDDGINSGLIKKPDLEKIEIWAKAKELVKKQNSGLSDNIETYQIIRTLINMQVNNLLESAQNIITERQIDSPEKVTQQKDKIISFAHCQMNSSMKELSDFLFKKLYRHFKVVRMSSKAKRFLKEIFSVYLDNSEQLPAKVIESTPADTSIQRTICDYIAGMTDRYALDEYKKLFNPWEKV